MDLSRFDDLPFHQHLAPFDQPATSDPHFNDGYYFAFYAPGVHVFCGLRRHPNNNVLDGYAGLTANGEQRDIRCSRAMRPRGDELAVGPLSLEILEPMRRQRIVLDESPERVRFDVELRAVAPPFAETPHIQWRHGRLLNHVLRYAQVCRATGWLEVDGERREVDEWHAARDHSWGLRAAMGPRTPVGGLASTAGDLDRRALRLWVPFEAGDHSGFFHLHEDAAGETLDFEGRLDLPGGPVDLVGYRHGLSLASSGRFESGEFVLVDATGQEHAYALEAAAAPAHPQGFGYDRGWSDGGNPGLYRGELYVESDRFDIDDNPAGGPHHVPEHRRLGGTETACRITGPHGATGMAHLELMDYRVLSR